MIPEAIASLSGDITKIKWPVRIALILMIHRSYLKEIPSWTAELTANLINKDPIYVKESIKLAIACRIFEGLDKIKRQETAYNVIKKDEHVDIIRSKIKTRLERQNGKHG